MYFTTRPEQTAITLATELVRSSGYDVRGAWFTPNMEPSTTIALLSERDIYEVALGRLRAKTGTVGEHALPHRYRGIRLVPSPNFGPPNVYFVRRSRTTDHWMLTHSGMRACFDREQVARKKIFAKAIAVRGNEGLALRNARAEMIYALSDDPYGYGLFYVGRTKDVEARYFQHMTGLRSSVEVCRHVCRMFEKTGYLPFMRFLEVVSAYGRTKAGGNRLISSAEASWIRRLSAEGHHLVNITYNTDG